MNELASVLTQYLCAQVEVHVIAGYP